MNWTSVFRRQVAGDGQRTVHPVIAAGEADHRGTTGVFFASFSAASTASAPDGPVNCRQYSSLRPAGKRQVFGEAIFNGVVSMASRW